MFRLVLFAILGVSLSFCQTATSVTLSSSATAIVLGQPAILTATVTPSQAAGSVTFYDGTTILGTAALTNGSGNVTALLQTPGKRSLTARYLGNASYTASVSQPLTQIVSVAASNAFAAPASYATNSAINQHVAIADFNGDGIPDLVTNNYSVLLGNGDGTFRPTRANTYAYDAYSVATADFDGDGKQDFAATSLDGGITIWLGNGDGTFQAPALVFPSSGGQGLVAADFNNDGIADLATASPHGISVMLGKGDGTFAAAQAFLTTTYQTALAVADFDGDGKPDIVSVDSNDLLTPVNILMGNGDGTFRSGQVIQAAFPQAVATGDFNRDGKPDFVVSDPDQNQLRVFLGNGDGTFTQTANPLPSQIVQEFEGVAVGDFDGDGNPDIAATGAGSQNSIYSAVSIYTGNGDGTFRAPVNFPAGTGITGSVIAGEFNGDGRTDLAVTNPASVQILLGATGSFPVPPEASTLPGAMGGVPYSDTLSATGGSTPYTWSLIVPNPEEPFATLPGGLILGGDGTIEGTVPSNRTPVPSTPVAGTYSFPVMVTGPTGPGFYSGENLSIPLAAAFQIISGTNSCYVGQANCSAILQAMGGTPPYNNWQVISGNLPPGFTLNPATGVLSGLPLSAATYTVTLTVNDSSGLASLAATYDFRIVGDVTIVAQSLPNAFIGEPYSVTLQGTGGFADYQNWDVTAGSLPPGLKLNGGIIGGTPTSAAGSPFTFSVVMTDSFTGVASPQSFTIAVVSPTGTTPAATGIANAASGSQAPAGVVGVGSYVAIYGSALAGTGNGVVTTLPLPTSFNNTEVTLGGLPMPLLYAASGQINALVPQGFVEDGDSYPLTISTGNNRISITVKVVALQPGIYTQDTSGSGAGMITSALTGNLITPTNPANAGDYIVVYCTGLGAVQGPNAEPAPLDGAEAPSNLIYRTGATWTATIDGVNAPVVFAGLTPAFAGLYQVNIQVPPGVSAGIQPLVLSSTDPNSGAAVKSNQVTVAIQ